MMKKLLLLLFYLWCLYGFGQTYELSGGNGIEHFFLTTTAVYTLDTWESNGGKIKVESINGPSEIYDIRIVVFRLHKAR